MTNATHPGKQLENLLIERGRSQDEFADIIDKPKSKLNAIIRGTANITTERAIALEKAFSDTSYDADKWLQIQNKFDLENVKKGKDLELIGLKAKFPIRELTKRGWIKGKDSKSIKGELSRIFKVDNITSIFNQGAVYKRTDTTNFNENSMKVRLQLAKIEANDRNIAKYDKDALIKFSKEIPELTLQGEQGILHASESLQKAGVGFVMLKHFEKTRVDGATCRNTETNNPTIILSIRYDRLNNFRFTLAHEIGHVLLHEDILKTESIIEDYSMPEDKIEIEANAYANNLLIKEEYWKTIINGPISGVRINRIGEKIKVHPSIIVGRLQHDHIIDYYQLSRIGNEKIKIPAGIWLK